MNSKRVVKILIVVILIVIGAFIYKNNNKKEVINSGYDNSDKRIEMFKSKYKKAKILKTAEENLTTDDNKDLVIVFNDSEEANYMVTVVDDGNNIYITPKTRAPRENIEIKFKDIDNKKPMEAIVSGSKNGNTGYAIYRIENKKMIDLFGEGMRDCC